MQIFSFSFFISFFQTVNQNRRLIRNNNYRQSLCIPLCLANTTRSNRTHTVGRSLENTLVLLSGHWIILQNQSLSFDSTQFNKRQFQRATRNWTQQNDSKITQQLNFERTTETQNSLGWKEHLIHNYMLFFYKIG